MKNRAILWTMFLAVVLLAGAFTPPASQAARIDAAEMISVTCDGFTILTRSDPGTVNFVFQLQATNPAGPVVTVSGSFEQTEVMPNVQSTVFSWADFPSVYVQADGTLLAGDYVVVNSPQDDPGRTITLVGANTLLLHYSEGPLTCQGPEPYCGDGILQAESGEECDDGNNIDGDGCSANCTIEETGGDGCTPGYWKQDQHFDSWTAPYAPGTLFSDVFEDAFPGMTLLEVLQQGGGGLKALGRHTVAALLNAASPGVNYDRSTSQVIMMFNSVYPGSKGDYEGVKNMLEGWNEQGCPLN